MKNQIHKKIITAGKKIHIQQLSSGLTMIQKDYSIQILNNSSILPQDKPNWLCAIFFLG